MDNILLYYWIDWIWHVFQREAILICYVEICIEHNANEIKIKFIHSFIHSYYDSLYMYNLLYNCNYEKQV